MSSEKVLVIDDDKIARYTLQNFLEKEGYEVMACDNGLTGIAEYKRESFGVVLCDLIMRGIDGVSVIKELKSFDPQANIIMMTAYGTIDNAVEAMKVGAFHYITKPFRPDDLSGTIKKAVEFKKLGKENLDLKQPLKEKCSKDLVEHMEIFKVGIDSYRENDVVKIRDLQTVNSDQSTMNSFNGVDLVLAENGIDLNNVLEEFEKKLIFQALRASNGIKSRAARYLKLNRTTLIEKLKRLRIPD